MNANETQRHSGNTGIIILLAVVSIIALIIHIIPDGEFGLHRDEYLYLALGRHPGWGYWSNPPFIGWIGFIAGHLPLDPVLAARIIPAVAGALLVLITGLVTRELGGGIFAITVSSLALVTSILFLRAFSMLMPVAFDILFWSLFLYAFLRFINSRKNLWLYVMGVTAGIGMLNKYMIGFLIAAMFAALILSRHRNILKGRHIWLAALCGALILLPNVIWQYRHGFPVTRHLNELAATQLVNVRRTDIIIDQVLMYFASSLIWIAGLIWLAGRKNYRVFLYLFLIVIASMVFLRGKSYYTAGLYPFFIAAGGVFSERVFARYQWKLLIPFLIIVLNLPLVPGGIPVGKRDFISGFYIKAYEVTGIDAILRWEDGKVHSLPQDYADRTGWEVLGGIVKTVTDTTTRSVVVFCENYGQAAAIEFYDSSEKLRVQSFSDYYLLHAMESWPEDAVCLYIGNDEPGDDVSPLFGDVDLIRGINDDMAREYGTNVYHLKDPRPEFYDFWTAQVREARREAGLDKFYGAH